MTVDTVPAEPLEDACFTVEQLAGACAVNVEWVVRRVEDGVFAVTGSTAIEWRFTSRDLHRARVVRALERDFDAVPELAALVADLLEEVRVLRARVHT
ncbi:MAG: MerR family transcriptional regulator [Burkholderiales bacterium]|nr:MerR family transcriptional regulator [Burkholderiales bacterium]